MIRHRIAILGAGFAGLVTARELERQGHDVIVLEASSAPAGLAASTVDEHGFTYDVGAHFITNRLVRELGTSTPCPTVTTYSEGVWLDGRRYAYPLGLLRRADFLASALASRGAAAKATNADEWFRRRYGDRAAERVALPLLAEWAGAPANELSADVGRRLAGGPVRNAYLAIGGRLLRRPVAIGYCKERKETLGVWHVYPDGGVGKLCQELLRDLRGEVRLGAPIQEIVVRDGLVREVVEPGGRHEVTAVVSTLPVTALARLVRDGPSLERYESLRFRALVIVNVRLEGRGLLPDVVLWTPEPSFGCFRVNEVPRAAPSTAPEGRTLLTVDYGAEVGDEVWRMSDDDLAARAVEDLMPIVPDARSRMLGAHVVRVPAGYPIFRADQDELRRSLSVDGGSGIDNLMFAGRNAEFDHLLMEDVYWRTIERLRRWRALDVAVAAA